MQNRRSQPDEVYNSNLFSVRLWYEHLGGSEKEWRGRVEHIPSKEARYFREWSSLIAFFQEVLNEQNLLNDHTSVDPRGEEE